MKGSRRGAPPLEDESIAAQLMRVRDEKGNTLPHGRQWSELSIFFYAGVSPAFLCPQQNKKSISCHHATYPFTPF